MDELGQAGATVAGCRLGTVIGTTGSSRVWLATDRANGRRVAVKVVRGPLPMGERLRVRHPHLIAVQRVSDQPSAVIMDFAEGGSLAAVVAARGPLDVGEVVTVLVGLAGALTDLHRMGVVHGDVTGSNVLFLGDGRPVLGDLGALRVAGAGPVVATAGFAAPEVLAGSSAGWAADVHGLCAVAWLALTGSAPAPASSRAPLSVLAPQTPVALVDVVSRGLDPDPARRPPPAEILEIGSGVGRAEPVRLVGAAMPALPAPEAVTHRLREWSVEASAARYPDEDPGVVSRRPVRRRSGPWRRAGLTALAGAGLGVLVAGVGVLSRGYDAPAAGSALPSVAPVSAPAGSVEHDPSTAPPALAAPEAEEIVAVAHDLVRLRTAALRAGDGRALEDVYAAGAAAAVADRQLISRTGPVDVTVTVAAVRALEVAADTAAVVVVMATEVTPSTARPGPADPEVPTSAVRMDLALTPDGWRILQVVPADAGP